MPYKQQLPHFHLPDNIKYRSMVNCSIYISWKTKFAILNGKTSKIISVMIVKEWVNSIFFTYWWKDTFGIHPLHMSPKWNTWHYVQSTFLLNLLLKFSFEAPATEDIKHVCDRQTYHWLCKKKKKYTNKPLRVWLFSSNSMLVNMRPCKCQQS